MAFYWSIGLLYPSQGLSQTSLVESDFLNGYLHKAYLTFWMHCHIPPN